jgi:hypothetical protein
MAVAQFVIHPDYEILNKYLVFPQSFDKYTKSCIVEVPRYYDRETVNVFKTQFTKTTVLHGIAEHTDNLMLVALLKLIEFDEEIDLVEDEQKHLLKYKDLAILLTLAIENASSTKVNLKIGKDNYSLSDGFVKDWLSNLILADVKSGNILLSEWGTPPYLYSPIGEINYSELEIFRKLKVKPLEDKLYKLSLEHNTLFCVALLPYLNGETILAKGDKNNFSNSQLSFLYDLLVALKLRPSRLFNKPLDYEAKDYLRSQIVAYAKKINRNGKQLLKTL